MRCKEAIGIEISGRSFGFSFANRSVHVYQLSGKSSMMPFRNKQECKSDPRKDQ